MRPLRFNRHGLLSARAARTFGVSVALCGALALAACGYRPLYGQAAANADQDVVVMQHLSAISVANIPDRVGQMMRTALDRRLSPTAGGPSRYTLRVDLSESIQTQAEERSGFATRANLRIFANYRLTQNSNDASLTSGQVQAVASYNILDSNYATLVARDDARERAIENVADFLRIRLAAHFTGTGPATTPPERRRP